MGILEVGGLSVGALISAPIQLLVITRQSYLGGYLEGTYLRNFTVGVLNNPFGNLANVQKDYP